MLAAMGVQGLSSYMSRRSDQYLRHHELRDCYVVIDGNNLASELHDLVSHRNCAFGGDYDRYTATVKRFFKHLRRCNVEALVLLDGGHDSRKFPVVAARLRRKLADARRMMAYPLLMMDVFKDALSELGVRFIQCLFEADDDIAAVAKALSCPVLSGDSDFFLYDVRFIPLFSLLMGTDHGLDRCPVTCGLFSLDAFLDSFGGLHKSLLPLVGVLLGNDYGSKRLLSDFLSQIKQPRRNSRNVMHSTISDVVHWLSKESFESAVPKILGCLKEADRRAAAEEIGRAVSGHSVCAQPLLSALRVETAVQGEGRAGTHLPLPSWFVDSFQQGHLPRYFMDMLANHVYFMSPQVDDCSRPCSHTISLPLVRLVFGLLMADADARLTCYRRGAGCQLVRTQLSPVHRTASLAFPPLRLLRTLPATHTHLLLFEALECDAQDRAAITALPDRWSLMAAVLIYWVRHVAEPALNEHHVRAMAFTMVVLAVASGSSDGDDHHQTGSRLTQMLASIPAGEQLTTHDILLRLTKRSKPSSILTVHAFAQFQSCCLHAAHLNALLGFPLPPCHLSYSYSGTVLCNTFARLQQGSRVEDLLIRAPAACAVYKALHEALICLLPGLAPPIKRQRTRRKR